MGGKNQKRKFNENVGANERCELNGNLIDPILRTLRLLSGNIEKYFPSPDISLDWLRDLFVLSACKLVNLKITE